MENGPGAGQDTEFVAPQTGQDTPRTPARQPWWTRFHRRQRPNEDSRNTANESIVETDEARQQVAFDQEQSHRVERARTPEEIINIQNVEEALAVASNLTFVQYRQRELQAQYGEGVMGQFRAAMAGEYDFHLDEDGEVQRDARDRCIEAGRRILRAVVNKHTVISTVTAMAVGALTGGIGTAAAAVVAGGVSGRGAGEIWEALGGRRVRTPDGQFTLREVIARRQFEEQRRLKDMARSASTPESTDDERNLRLLNLVDAQDAINEETVQRQRELLTEDALWNRRRDICAKIGASAAAIGGLLAGAYDFMKMDIHGLEDTAGNVSHVGHHVEYVDGQWQFAYKDIPEAIMSHGDHLEDLAKDSSDRLIHSLGESTATVIGKLAQNMAPMLATFGSLFASRAWERHQEVGRAANFETNLADERHEAQLHNQFIREQIPGGQEQPPQSENTRERWVQAFREERRLPAQNDVWVVRNNNEEPIIFRLNTVNLESGQANVTQLDHNFRPVLVNGQEVVIDNFALSELAEHGARRDEVVASWIRQFQQGDQVQIPVQAALHDKEGRLIPIDRYEVITNPQNPGEVTLRRPGADDIIASALQFGLWGINRFNPAPAASTPERPVVERPGINQIWQFQEQNRASLPAYLRAVITENMVVTDVAASEFWVNSYDLTTHAIIPGDRVRISMQEWQEIQQYFVDTHREAAPSRQNSGGNPPTGGARRPRGGAGGGGGAGGAGQNPPTTP